MLEGGGCGTMQKKRINYSMPEISAIIKIFPLDPKPIMSSLKLCNAKIEVG